MPSAGADRRHVQWRSGQRQRRACGSACRTAYACRFPRRSGGQGRRARRPAGAAPHGTLRRQGAQRILAWRNGEKDKEYREPGHRRLRNRRGHGLGGAAALRTTGHAVQIRVQRGRRGLLSGHARPGPARNAIHRLFENLPYSRNPAQCGRGPRLVPGRHPG
ncbi:hypothetical protein D3C87_1312610 [compost metagenome]